MRAIVAVALCVASIAHAQDIASDVLVVSDVRYRLTAVNSSLMLRPDVPFATRGPGPVLAQDEKLARCDQFVALALASRGYPAVLVRVRVEPTRDDQVSVVYEQRHQGYKIIGAGGRLEVDSRGRVQFAGLTYETEKLRTFRPMSPAALAKRAAPAVPHPRLGPPISQELMIDPLGDAPAQLRAYFIYQVKNRDRPEPWEVIVDAETGEVRESFSLFMNVGAAPAGGPSR